MSISKTTILNNIESYLQEMKLLILRSGFWEEKYNSILDRIAESEEDELLAFSEALTDLMTTQWKAAYNIWILPCLKQPERAPAIWAHYDAMGFEDHREQKMLADALKVLNTEFKRVYSQCLPRKKRKSAPSRSSENSPTP